MSEKFVFKKPNFGPPPAGYIAGLGRGATGFITRSDLGPSRVPQNSQIKQQTNQQNDQGAFVDSKYDNWEGYRAPLFSKNQMDDQDRQAQQAYDYCQRKMDQRKQKAREQKNVKDIQQIKKDNAPINQNFKDLKRELAKISYQQWQNIPESYDSSIKKKNRQKYTPVPDSLVINFLNNNSSNNAVDPQAQTNQDYRDAKQILLKSKLDKAEQKVERQTLDKIGYMTQLNTSKLGSDILGDVPKARLLLKSAMQSNPKNPDIWISAARVQQLDGKINQARQILRKATSFCPLTEDIWIQLSRIQKFQSSKNVLIEGLKHLPNSEKMWTYASKLQNDRQMKSKILRKGLENNPQSVRLWKELIQLESLQQARTLLYKAVQFLPNQIDLWLALSKIQPYQSAKLVLNKARKSNPLSLQVWINAVKLQEAQFIKNSSSKDQYNSNSKATDKFKDKIQNILVKARQVLKKNGRNVNRDQWLDQALYCQKSQNFLTCETIVKISIVHGLSQEQIVNTVLKDAKIFEEQKQSIQTTRFIYKHGLLSLKNKILLEKFILFQERSEKKVKELRKEQNQIFSSTDHLYLFQVLKLSTNLFPEDAKFWCLIIEKYLNENSLSLAQDIIVKAEQTIQEKQTLQSVKLLKVKLFVIQQKFTEAKCQLQIMSELYPKGKSRVQLIKLLYSLKQYQRAWELCEKYFKQMHSEEIWELAYKILNKLDKKLEAKNILEAATSQLPNSIILWKLLLNVELSSNHLGKVRSTLDKAILKNPKSEQLYIAGVQIQLQYGSSKQAIYFLSKALKSCPKSPQLWGISVQIQPVSTRKKRASVALQNCGVTSSFLNCSIAKIFWKQNKIDKAKKWLNSSLELDKENGDIWILYIYFLEQKYPLEAKIMYKQFLQAEIKSGRKWKKYIQDINQKQSKEQIFQIVKKQFQRQLNRII